MEINSYDAFGAATIWNASGAAIPTSGYQNRFLFTGREWLADAGIYDYRNRVYSPALGRFLQTDPIRFSAGDRNIYRYCGNNPVSLWDAYGLCDGKTVFMGFSFTGIIGDYGSTWGFGAYFSNDGIGVYGIYGEPTAPGFELSADVNIGFTSTDKEGFSGEYNNTSISSPTLGVTGLNSPSGQPLGGSINIGTPIPGYSQTRTNTDITR